MVKMMFSIGQEVQMVQARPQLVHPRTTLMGVKLAIMLSLKRQGMCSISFL